VSTLIRLASLTIAGYALWYLMLCSASPLGKCRRCDGAGRRGKRRSPCRRCEGTGHRVRIGRRLYEYLRAEHDKGNR
jgi:hypothetical protein